MEERKGIVTAVRRNGDQNEYVIFDGERYHRVLSKKRIRGRSVKITPADIEELKEDIFEEIRRRFFEKVRPSLELPEEISFLRPQMELLWKEIAFAKISGERPMVYFDPDADGIVSLLFLSEVIKLNYKPLNPWNLETGSSLHPDLRSSFFLLLDMGSTEDAHPGVNFLSSLKKTYVLDHHASKKLPPFTMVINPAVKNPSLSRYTTAYLTHLLVKHWVEKEEWLKVGVAGDKSDVIPWTKEHRRKALALELAPDVFGINLGIFKQVLDTDLWKPLWDLFLARMEKIEEMAEKEELEVNGKKVLIVRYSSPGFYYPHRGKVASWFLEKGYDLVIVEEIPKVKIYTVSLRSREDLFPLLEAIQSKGIGRGWGHPNAVTLKVEDVESAEKFILGWLNGQAEGTDRVDEKKG
ncbi:MAG: hypothetical protein GXO00_00630 [Candidatus Diapherotrites archaeon]|nr:hypothetical protein [Candidatus Diapherotrites archaeon]